VNTVKLTLKTWPAIFLITVAFSFMTQCAAKRFGIELPEQTNLELVRSHFGWNLTFASIVFQIAVLMPALEEIIFRYALFKLPLAAVSRFRKSDPRAAAVSIAVISAAVFSFAHYIDYMALFKKAVWSLRPADNAFLALWFFGMAQCWLYRRTSSIGGPILNHTLFNTTNLILLFVFNPA